MDEVMKPYLYYLRLKICSSLRLFNAFPIVAKVLFIVIAVVFGYLLTKIEYVHDASYFGWTTLIFILLGMAVCRIKHTETVLLKSLHIPFSFIFLVRCVLLSIPFLLTDWSWGFLSVMAGTPFVVFFSLYRKRLGGSGMSILHHLRFPGLFGAAYQWVSAYRTDVLWVVVIGSMLFLIALANKNPDMALAMMGFVVCYAGFSAYYIRRDSAAFLRIYKHASFMMVRKAKEAFFFSVIPLCWFLPLSGFVFPDSVLTFAGLSISLLYANMILMYSSYVFYPNTLIPLIVSTVLFLISAVLFVVFPMLFAAGLFAVILFLSHYAAVSNLKSPAYDL